MTNLQLQQFLTRARGRLSDIEFGTKANSRRHCCLANSDLTLRKAFTNIKVFVRNAWLDFAVMVVLGAACIGVWLAPHAFTRYFPVTFFGASGDIVYAQFAYPYIPPPVSSVVAAIVSAFIPIATFLLLQFWIRDFEHIALAILGLKYALLTGTLFQVVLKKTIGGLRPHFLTVCEPILPLPPFGGVGFQNVMFTVDDVCRGDANRINNATESFPSGHANVAYAGLGYLTLYLLTYFSVGGSREGRRNGQSARYLLWRVPIIMAPMLLATYIASGLVLSYNHHAYDVIAGGAIGSTAATLAFTAVFWDRTYNTKKDFDPDEAAEDDTHMRLKARTEPISRRPNEITSPTGDILPR